MPEKSRANRSGSRKSTSDTHHHHHHHHRGVRRYIRHKLHKHKWLGPGLLIALAVILGAGFWLKQNKSSQDAKFVKAGERQTVVSNYREVTYGDQEYRFNSRLTAILYACVDKETSENEASEAEGISLIVLDEKKKLVTIIALDPGTAVETDAGGNGKVRARLGSVYAMSGGGTDGSQKLAEAVSNLFYGIPVREYLVADRASLAMLGELIGPVTVTVPSGDLQALGFVEGEEAVIDASNLDVFVNSKGEGRVERQQAYLEAALQRMGDLLTGSASMVWDIMQAAEENIQTDITRSRYLSLGKVLNNTVHAEKRSYVPEGVWGSEGGAEMLFLDEEALLSNVVEIFYIEK